MPAGRPSEYSQEIASDICERIAGGESLRAIGQQEGMPSDRSIYRWLADPDRDDFRQQYARAREQQCEYFLEEIFEIADDGSRDSFTDSDGYERINHDHINRSRLRVDARKWAMSKL